ncbi:MAG: shikimate kinase [Euryarchaeota archaeon]|nr:shikimate kinase [Euryarchaeota archaeon]
MKTVVRSPGSATVINAISTGYGSAFGIKLYVTAEVELKSSKIKCTADKDVDTTLMKLCVSKVLEKFKLETGVLVKTSSNLPVASGLSSSSATSNAVVLATTQAVIDVYNIKSDVNNFEILNIAIDSSLEAGVTITGAFDDASASFFGGLTITDNINRKILKKQKMKEQKILIYMPNKYFPTAESDVRRMKLIAPHVKLAFDEALEGNINEALTLNGLLYCAALRFDPNIALDAVDAGAIACGLSGTGPSFVAIVDERNTDRVEDAWSSYPGKIIHTEVDNEGTKVLRSG